MDIQLAEHVQLCAVTKKRGISEIEALLNAHPEIHCIAENRWPDCVQTFEHFKNLEKHFIGPLQSNKIRKILPLVDVIQSVDSIKLFKKIDQTAKELKKTIKFCFQVNISHDPNKKGLMPNTVDQAISAYLESQSQNLELIGLMTIGRRGGPAELRKYFQEFKKLFDKINQKHFPHKPLKVLSMGMSEDYHIAIESGSTMVRLGRNLFHK